MSISAPSLSPAAASTVRELEARGITPTLDEILRLQDAGRLVDKPEPHRSTLNAWPVRAGNVVVFPFTIGAWVWWKRYGLPLTEGDAEISAMTFAFAMAHAPDVATLLPLTTYALIKTAVDEWMAGVNVTVDDLDVAMNVVLDGRSKPDGKKKKDDADDDTEPDTEPAGMWEETVEWLVREHGHTRDFWMWSETQAYALHLIDVYRMQQQGTGAAPDPNDPLVRATHDLRVVVSSIIEAHKNG